MKPYDARRIKTVHPDVVNSVEFQENLPTRKPSSTDSKKKVPLMEAIVIARDYYNQFPGKQRRRIKK